VETRFFAVSNPSSTARPEGFSPDPRIEPEYQVNTHYWTATGYDRGHMAPNWGVSICYGRDAQVQTFLLTNVIPQSPALNRGLWETLEKIISNDYAERFGQVWVICGPIFGSNLGTLKDGKVLIFVTGVPVAKTTPPAPFRFCMCRTLRNISNARCDDVCGKPAIPFGSLSVRLGAIT
jgi:hypothetical protein